MNAFRFILALALITSSHLGNAQVEVSHLRTKNFSSTGFGAFLHFDIPVSEADYITAEAGFGLFRKNDQNVGIAPMLLGYRHTLDRSGTGFYIEPAVGYTFGGSDIFKYDKDGSPIYDVDGSQLEQKVKGLTAGIGTGYMLPSIPVNIGAAYKFVKVSGDPSMHLFSIRLSYALMIGNRGY
jgi:hypothetical protein